MGNGKNVVFGNFGGQEVLPQASDDFLIEMEELARSHGYSRSEDESLRFEAWLDGCSYYITDYSVNLALVDFDPGATYFARVEGPNLDDHFVIVFSIKPKFVYGESWHYGMSVHLVCDTDNPGSPEFCADQESGPLLVSIRPINGEFDLTISDGLRLDFLIPAIRVPLENLMILFAEHAAAIRDTRVN